MAFRLPLSLMLLGMGFVAGTAVSTASGEGREPLIYVVDFMKVSPGDGRAYVELEKGPWKAVHEERISRGLMRGWALYEVRYPLGTARPYDYVTVNVFDSFADAERDPALLLESVLPDVSKDEVLEETLAVRDLVRGEIWYRLDSAGVTALSPSQ